MFKILILTIAVAYIHVYIIFKLREIDLWWSNISTIEKEISYRTEQGLYYSYYKTLVTGDTFSDSMWKFHTQKSTSGFRSIIADNVTESPNVINIFYRMNILPELCLACTYKLFSSMEPIDFYELAAISLQSLTLFSIGLIAYRLTHRWEALVLCAVCFLQNQQEMSRVTYTLPLRENFSLPFWWLRMFCVTMSLESITSISVTRMMTCLLWLSTAMFCMTWQFSQFALLLDTGTVMILNISGFINDSLYLNERDVTKIGMPMNLISLIAIAFFAHTNRICFESVNHSHLHVICLKLSYASLYGLVCSSLSQAGNMFPFASPCFSLLLSNVFSINTNRFIARYSTEEKTKNANQTADSKHRLIKFLGLFPLSFILSVYVRLGLATIICISLKNYIPTEDASHIVRFLQQKFNIDSTIDFHTALYLCSGAFQSMDLGQYLTQILPGSRPFLLSYVVGLARLSNVTQILQVRKMYNRIVPLSLKCNLVDKSQEKFPTDGLWHLAYNIIFGLLAWSTQRMQYFWTPHVILVTTVGCVEIAQWSGTGILWNLRFISTLLAHNHSAVHKKTDTIPDRRLLTTFVEATRKSPINNVRMRQWRDCITTALVIVLFLQVGIETTLQLSIRFQQLKEFYDPDTVDLMHWIKNKTEPNAIFTGSMQLMAGVKLCTKRPIANHPHYENAALRERTRHLYQIYGRKPIPEVHSMLVNRSINYIILETSLCFTESTGCAERDLVDLDNLEWPDMWVLPPDLASTGQLNPAYTLDMNTKSKLNAPTHTAKRFCSILIGISEEKSQPYQSLQKRQMTRLFTPMFKNPTFHVFSVNRL